MLKLQRFTKAAMALIITKNKTEKGEKNKVKNNKRVNKRKRHSDNANQLLLFLSDAEYIGIETTHCSFKIHLA